MKIITYIFTQKVTNFLNNIVCTHPPSYSHCSILKMNIKVNININISSTSVAQNWQHEITLILENSNE